MPTRSSNSSVIRMLPRVLALALCCAAGCTVSDSSKSADSAALADSAAPAEAPVVRSKSPARSATTPSDPTPSDRGTVAFDGVPPLRVGMSAADARRALGIAASGASASSCSYLDTKGKSKAYVMLQNDTIARLEIRDRSLATTAGARVGDSEASVLALYRGHVTTQPHKYLPNGHYLVVTTPADGSLRLVLETDGKQVTTLRVGREPEVEQVEGCG
jgi:hypothetical protein